MTDGTVLRVGDRLADVRIGPIAHGGHWVARHEGRVLFVRHTLEGERVDIVITGLGKRHAFADAVAVRTPSPHRVEPLCPIAAACGGCDFQHIEVPHQRELKRQVVAEQLRRLAGIEWAGTVEASDPEVMGWRTRMRYHRGPHGWGLRARSSHQVIELPETGCLIAAPALARPDVATSRQAVTGDEMVAVQPAEEGALWCAPGSGITVTERTAGRTWGVQADGFWQVHPRAADTLVGAVLAALAPQPGERALDLYCGVGLFADALVDAGVGVVGVEGNRAAVALARVNVPQASFRAGVVERVLPRLRGAADLVILDPPRAGAGRTVIEQVCRRRPRAIGYVACDPAALARDLATASGLGYRAASVRAFDLFGMTHHVECVALLVR